MPIPKRQKTVQAPQGEKRGQQTSKRRRGIPASLVAYVASQPDLVYTNTGLAIATFVVAIPADEEGQDSTWLRVTAWRELAESVAEVLGKGDRVKLDGELFTHWYQEKPQLRLLLRSAALVLAGNNGQDKAEGAKQAEGGGKGKLPLPEDDFPEIPPF